MRRKKSVQLMGLSRVAVVVVAALVACVVVSPSSPSVSGAAVAVAGRQLQQHHPYRRPTQAAVYPRYKKSYGLAARAVDQLVFLPKSTMLYRI